MARGGQLDGRDGAACVAFIDDILIPGSTVAETSRRLKAVLDAIIKNGLKLAPKRCQLMQDELHSLGHHLSSEGISCQHEKICQIQNWPVPTSRKELKSVLDLFAYYSGFVPNFAGLAAPLYYLTRLDVPFVWNQQAQDAFQKLKEALVSPPILAYPRVSPPPSEEVDPNLKKK